MEGLTIFYVVAVIVVVGLIVYYLKGKGKGISPKEAAEETPSEPSEGPEE